MRNHHIETRRSPAGRPGSIPSGGPVLAAAAPPAKRVRGGFWVLTAILGLFLVASTAPLFGALDVFLLGAPAVVASVVLTGRPARPVMLGGCSVLVLGVTLTVISIATGTTPLFLAGTAVAGARFGAAFLGAFRTLAGLASPTRRGALVAAI